MRLFGFRIHLQKNPWRDAPPWAIELRKGLGLIIYQQEKLMATLDQVLADVTDESTKLDSLSALLSGLRQQVADVLSGANLPADVQAKVDAIFTQAEVNKVKIDTALNANVAAPPTA